MSKYFGIKHLREYHDLHIQSDTILISDVFNNFQSMWREIYEPEPTEFLSAPGLAWQAAFKKTKERLDLLTDINMLLMSEKISEVE